MDFQQDVFTVNFDFKEFPFITKDILAHRVEESAELTTSPVGVMTKIFVNQDNELCRWGADGKSHVIEKFEDYADARQAWLKRIYFSYYCESDMWKYDFPTFEDAAYAISMELDLAYDTVLSLLKHHELYRQIESKIVARRIMKRFYIARDNANGKKTKSLRRAMNDAMYPCYSMFGRSLPQNSQRLDVEDYYTEDFRKDLNEIHSQFLNYRKQ